MLRKATFLPTPKGSILACLFSLLFCTATFSSDDYWIGHSGDWSDLSHWVTTSRGSVQHDQIPTADDHVIFDSSSFINATNQIILDLDNIFTNNLDFRGPSQDLVLKGPSEDALNAVFANTDND